MEEINKFIENLVKSPVNGNFVNIYDYANENNKIRRENLTVYLQKMKNLNSKFILIGEAPGFRGCRFTGVPFISEYLNQYPLLWNVFPFHPHREYNKPKNRSPKEDELKIGLNFVDHLFKLFPNVKKVGAVGRKADDLLKINRNCEYIPHPSHCKKEHFIETLKGFFELN